MNFTFPGQQCPSMSKRPKPAAHQPNFLPLAAPPTASQATYNRVILTRFVARRFSARSAPLALGANRDHTLLASLLASATLVGGGLSLAAAQPFFSGCRQLLLAFAHGRASGFACRVLSAAGDSFQSLAGSLLVPLHGNVAEGEHPHQLAIFDDRQAA